MDTFMSLIVNIIKLSCSKLHYFMVSCSLKIELHNEICNCKLKKCFRTNANPISCAAYNCILTDINHMLYKYILFQFWHAGVKSHVNTMQAT